MRRHQLPRAVRPDDHCAVAGEAPVAPDVVEVPVSVDDEAHRPVAQLAQRSPDLALELGELGVDEQHSIRPGEHPDVASPATDHRNVIGELDGGQLDRVEVLRYARRLPQDQQQHNNQTAPK